MKLKIRKKFYIHIYYTLIVMTEILATVVAFLGITLLFRDVFKIAFTKITFIWLFLLTATISIVVSFFINKYIFRSIAKLGRAMGLVASGDFSVQLEPKSSISEINDIFNSFNLMTKELSATEILQTDFVSNVSHEFKTPLTAIEGYTTLLQNPDLTEEERLQYTEKILINTGRLSKLISNILLLSKVDNIAIRQDVSTYRLDEQIRQSVVMLESKWSEKDIDLDVDLDEVEYTGCEGLIIHVWNNLLSNAIKFGPRGGTVKLRLSKVNEAAVFTIEDSGPGIPEDAISHIFDKFYQSEMSHASEGNGLGLALVKRILDVCDGSIAVTNLPVGCRFTVTLI